MLLAGGLVLLGAGMGGAIGIAVVGSVLANTYRNDLDLSGVPAPLAVHAWASFAIASRLPQPIAHHAETAFTGGMQAALLVAAAAALTAAAGVVALLGRHGAAGVAPLARLRDEG
jgi:hypothetical protein